MKYLFLIGIVIFSCCVYSQNKSARFTFGKFAPNKNKIINSFHFSYQQSATNNLNLGGTLGVESFGNEYYAPIILDLKYYFTNDNILPYISVLAGYELSLVNGMKGGWIRHGGYTFGALFGADYWLSNHFGINGSIGYRYSFIQKKIGWFGPDKFGNYIGVENNLLEFRLGIIYR